MSDSPYGINTTRLQALRTQTQRSSNADTVSAIATGGHVASAGILAYGTGVAAAGGWAALRCFAGRVFVPLAGAQAGAALAQYLHADDAVLTVAELFGATPLAGNGPAPAHLGHKIAHSNAFAGLVTGILVGLAVGVLVAVSAAAIIGTGGMAAPLVGAAVAFAAGTAGGFAATAIAGAGAKIATVTGMIVEGSPDVFFEGAPVARVGDAVACSQHPGPMLIVEGSETIFINGMPLARIGHKISCAAVVQEGCTTISADSTTAAYGAADAELSVSQQLLLSTFEVVTTASSVREGGLLDGPLRRLFGEPIDVATGDYADYRIDFEYPSVLPLALARTYPGRDRVDGLFGRRWICGWSQSLRFADDGASVLLEDGAGQRLRFALAGADFEAVHLKAPHYRLSGMRQRACLFDARQQHSLVFTPVSDMLSQLSAIEDRNGNRIDFVYDGGHLRRIIHSDGVAFGVTTTREGYLDSLVLEGDPRVLLRCAYDAAGALTDIHSLFQGEFHYAYDSEGRLTGWRDSGPTRVELSYDRAGRVVATQGPDGLYQDRFFYDLAERRTDYVDATGATRRFWYNADNLVVREQDPLGQVTQYEWDALERLQAMADPAGRVTRFDYDAAGRLIESLDGAGRATRWQYDRWGQLTRLDHPDGRQSVWRHDARGNAVAWRTAAGQDYAASYDERGRLRSETGPDGAVFTWERDPLGRVAAVRDPLGHVTRVALDMFGRLGSVTDAEDRSTFYDYEASPTNPRAAVSRILRPDGGEERFDYDGEGLLARYCGAEGQVTRLRHGAFDLLRQAIDPAGHVTSFDYDGAARLTGVTNAAGAHWSYHYDTAGRVSAEIDWAGRQTGYRRDVLGRLTAKLLPDGTEQSFGWDERDRIVAVTAGDLRIGYAYDEADRLVRATTWRLGLDGAPGDPETEIRLVYDSAGQQIEEIQDGVALRYRYDAAGRCIGRASPSGEARLGLDPLGRLAGFESNGHRLSFARDAVGRETWRAAEGTAPTAFTLLQNYDRCGRLAGQRAGQQPRGADIFAPAQGAPAWLGQELQRRYAWDRAGRLVGVTDGARGETRYRYDPRDQVLQVERPGALGGALGGEQYRYDELMNLAASGAGPHEYNRDNVIRVGETRYEHDARGRVVTRIVARDGFRPKRWTYRWDALDRLVAVETPEGALWRYVYDAFGRRVRKEGGGAETRYLWQGATLAETQRGSTVERWHYEPDSFRPLAKEVVGAEAEASRLYPIVTDHLGTPKAAFSEAGECLWQAEHSLWGRAFMRRPEAPEGRPTPETEARCDLRFQNQWEDEESGLFYNLHRYYDPESGQYLSQDPIKVDGGLRTQGYVHDPVQWVDPLGLAKCANVTEEGVLRLRNKYNKGSAEDLALRKHVGDWNKQIKTSGGSMTRRAVTPQMRDAADIAAANAKAANPSAYPAGMAPGHTPDVGWGGDPAGPIKPLNSTVNSYVGGATQAVPPGTTYNRVQLFRD